MWGKLASVLGQRTAGGRHEGAALCVEDKCGSSTVGVILAGFSPLSFQGCTWRGWGGLCCHGTQRSAQQGLGDPISQRRTRGPRDVPLLPEDTLMRADPCLLIKQMVKARCCLPGRPH